MDAERTGAGLVGEEPRHPSPHDRLEWIAIYTDLIEFTEHILRETLAKLSVAAPPAARHLESTNVRVLREELAVFHRRRAALEAAGVDLEGQAAG